MSNLKDRALRAAERFVGHRGYDIVSTAYKLQDGGQIDICLLYTSDAADE